MNLALGPQLAARFAAELLPPARFAARKGAPRLRTSFRVTFRMSLPPAARCLFCTWPRKPVAMRRSTEAPLARKCRIKANNLSTPMLPTRPPRAHSQISWRIPLLRSNPEALPHNRFTFCDMARSKQQGLAAKRRVEMCLRDSAVESGETSSSNAYGNAENTD